MEKFVIWFVALMICVSPVLFAQDGGNGNGNGNEEPQENPTATTMKAEVKTFADARLKKDNGTYYVDLIGSVDTALEGLAFDAARTQFDPEAYMDGVDQKVQTMLNKINSYSKKGTCKDDYLDEISKNFVTEYANDIKNGVEGITTSQYLADYDEVYKKYEERLEDMNTEGGSGGDESTEYKPDEHLDKSALGDVAKAAKVEMGWAGLGGYVDDAWLKYDLVGFMKELKHKFGSDKTAQKDLNWIYQIWKKTEVDGMKLSYDDSQYKSWTGKQSGSYTNKFYVDEYGNLMTDAAQKQEYDQNEFKATEHLSKGDGTYNNRSFGYKYNNGTSTTIKVTAGGREYTLQESVYTSPIILDMNGDGRIEASNGKWLPHRNPEGKMVEFDMDGDGFIDLTEWVGPNDGILVAADKSGEITVHNFFGSQDAFFHGYEKLSLLDKNGDSVLSGEELKTLSVWQDKNSDAKVDNGEMVSVEQLGITSINLGYDNQFVSTFVQNGETKKVWDWYPSMMRIKRTK